jgi:hypothetical protein
MVNVGLITGHATHTRTQDSYMSALLDAVTLDDWREVVTGALQAARLQRGHGKVRARGGRVNSLAVSIA